MRTSKRSSIFGTKECATPGEGQTEEREDWQRRQQQIRETAMEDASLMRTIEAPDGDRRALIAKVIACGVLRRVRTDVPSEAPLAFELSGKIMASRQDWQGVELSIRAAGEGHPEV